jgi:glycerol-3-phosphate responsive antiterminator
MSNQFHKVMEECPVIAAVKDYEGLHRCLQSECKIIFVLFGDICSIREIVSTIKDKGYIAIVHMDLINGLAAKEVSVDFIRSNTEADGIISTKHSLIKRAKELGLFTVFRFFVIDSMAIDNIKKQCETASPDFIEIIPGVMPKVIKRICSMSSVPIIAGGLISDKEDVMAALAAGAISISTTNQEVWFM